MAVPLFPEYIKEAVAEDNAGNLQRAFELYKIALEYFSTHLKYEKNPRSKEAITAKVHAHTHIHTHTYLNAQYYLVSLAVIWCGRTCQSEPVSKPTHFTAG